MLGERAMACLAVDGVVHTGLLQGSHIRMAGLATLLASKMDGEGRNIRDRGSAIVSILPKTPGHNEVAGHKKYDDENAPQKCESEKMLVIFKAFHQPTSPSGQLLQDSADIVAGDSVRLLFIGSRGTLVCELHHRCLGDEREDGRADVSKRMKTSTRRRCLFESVWAFHVLAQNERSVRLFSNRVHFRLKM